MADLLGTEVPKTKREIYQERCKEKGDNTYKVKIHKEVYNKATEQFDIIKKSIKTITLSERDFKQFESANKRLGYKVKVISKPKNLK